VNMVAKFLGEVIGHAPRNVRFSEAEGTVVDHRSYHLERSEQRVLQLGLESGLNHAVR